MITVDRDKRNNTYRINIDYQDKEQHINGTAITLNESEAQALHDLLAVALGLGPGPEA
jgi:hypothetical protein